MAGQALTSRVTHANNTGWQNKALSAASTIGQGISIANGIREALPITGGVARQAVGYLPALAAAGAPFGLTL